MKKNVILDNEEVLILKGVEEYLVVSKKTSDWSILFAEDNFEDWFDILNHFSKETNEKIIKSGILHSFTSEEDKLFFKALKKETYATYIAEVFRDSDLIATTSEFSTYNELYTALMTTFIKEDLTINIYRTIHEPTEEGFIKQHHKFICEI